MSKPIQSIKLNKKEDAIIYYEKTLVYTYPPNNPVTTANVEYVLK